MKFISPAAFVCAMKERLVVVFYATGAALMFGGVLIFFEVAEKKVFYVLIKF